MRHTKALWVALVPLNEFIAPLTSGSHRPPDSFFGHSPHVALHSNCHDINANLMVEEALVRGVVLRPHERMLLFYRNDPCVVVGRNQNVFQEVAMRKAVRDRVTVARRASGGGAVYQDAGNLCLSFFTHRAQYAPEKTIQILRHGLCTLYGIAPHRLTTTKRHDLFLDGLKITGSAMRVHRDIAFHHCTLLVDTPLGAIGRYLRPEGDLVSFQSSSVGSVRSPVTSMAAQGLVKGVAADGSGAAAAHAEAFLADFFCSSGPFIAAHAAPWDLTLAEIQARSRESAREAEAGGRSCAANSVVLDVTAVGPGPTPFLLGEQRSMSATDSRTFQEEVARLRTADWQFAMPKYTTVVSVAAVEVDVPAPFIAHRDSLLALLFHQRTRGEDDVALLWETTIEHRRVTHVAVGVAAATAAAGGADAGSLTAAGAREKRPGALASRCDVTPVPWLQAFLQSVLVGGHCDAGLASLLPSGADGSAAPLRQGLEMELHGDDISRELAEAVPEEVRLESILAVVKALVAVWRRKNVLDVFESTP